MAIGKLMDASRQFSGLSARALADVLRAMPLERLAALVRWTAAETSAAISVRDDLLARLTALE